MGKTMHWNILCSHTQLGDVMTDSLFSTHDYHGIQALTQTTVRMKISCPEGKKGKKTFNKSPCSAQYVVSQLMIRKWCERALLFRKTFCPTTKEMTVPGGQRPAVPFSSHDLHRPVTSDAVASRRPGEPWPHALHSDVLTYKLMSLKHSWILTWIRLFY